MCILVLKKCKQQDYVLFINAAEHFEKGKRQNRLLAEHIEKEGFNLNISRYISTAQAEEEIDLQAVHRQLADIEKEIATAKDKHNGFLKELGLPLLP